MVRASRSLGLKPKPERTHEGELASGVSGHGPVRGAGYTGTATECRRGLLWRASRLCIVRARGGHTALQYLSYDPGTRYCPRTYPLHRHNCHSHRHANHASAQSPMAVPFACQTCTWDLAPLRPPPKALRAVVEIYRYDTRAVIQTAPPA